MSIDPGTWLRRTVVAIGILLVLALLALGVTRIPSVRLRAQIAKMKREGIYVDLSKLEHRNIPDQENAVFWLRQGSGAFNLSPEEREFSRGVLLRPYREWDASVTEAARRVVAGQEKALALLHRAGPCRESDFGYTYESPSFYRVWADEFAPLLRSMALLALQARLNLADGDNESAAQAMTTLGALAFSIEREPGVTDLSYAEGLFLEITAEALEDGRPFAGDPEWLRRLDSITWGHDHVDLYAKKRGAAVYVFEHATAAELVGCLELQDVVSGPQESESAWERFGERLMVGLQAVQELEYERRAALQSRVPWLKTPTPFRPSADVTERIYVGEAGKAQDLAGIYRIVKAGISLRRIAAVSGAYPPERPAIPELDGPDPFTGAAVDYNLRPDGTLDLIRTGAEAGPPNSQKNTYPRCRLTLPAVPTRGNEQSAARQPERTASPSP